MGVDLFSRKLTICSLMNQVIFGAGNAFGVVQFALIVSPAKYFNLSVISIGL